MASTWLCPAFSAKILADGGIDGGILKLKVRICWISSVDTCWYYALSLGLSIHVSIRERDEEILELPLNCVTHFYLQDQQTNSNGLEKIRPMPTKNNRKQQTKTSTEQLWQPINPPQ